MTGQTRVAHQKRSILSVIDPALQPSPAGGKGICCGPHILSDRKNIRQIADPVKSQMPGILHLHPPALSGAEILQRALSGLIGVPLAFRIGGR